MDLRLLEVRARARRPRDPIPDFLVPEGAGEANARPMSRRAGRGAATGEPGRPPFRITPEGAERARAASRFSRFRWRVDYVHKYNLNTHNPVCVSSTAPTNSARLDAALQHPGSLTAIWGRRRVGKSRLLLEWSSRHDGLYTVADLSAPPVQRRYLAAAVAERFPGFASVEYPDWRSFLDRLRGEAAAAGWPGPLILDELPYLLATDPSFASVLQNWLDRPGPRPSLVVSGSSWRMMHGALLRAAAPLYGRAVEAFAVQPLRPGYLADAFRRPAPRTGGSLRALGRHAALLGTRGALRDRPR